MRLCAVAAVATVLTALLVAVSPAVAAPSSQAHRNGCHVRKECPSDHATYVWRGLRCVKPTSDERTAAFKRKVVYGGLTYYCKRA